MGWFAGLLRQRQKQRRGHQNAKQHFGHFASFECDAATLHSSLSSYCPASKKLSSAQTLHEAKPCKAYIDTCPKKKWKRATPSSQSETHHGQEALRKTANSGQSQKQSNHGAKEEIIESWSERLPICHTAHVARAHNKGQAQLNHK